jgi:ribosomal-protein-alanine N-acetyltransferase
MEKFETDRAIFTLYEENLREDFMRLFTDETVMRYVDKGVLSREAAGALWQRLTQGFYPRGIATIWAVLAKEDSRFIGHASIRPRPENKFETEIGYILAQDEWGKGYATEIAAKLIEIGFNELDLGAVYATVDTGNDRSIRVLEKCGMNVVRTEYNEAGKFYLYGVKRPDKRK